jgi:hypothetical protein
MQRLSIYSVDLCQVPAFSRSNHKEQPGVQINCLDNGALSWSDRCNYRPARIKASLLSQAALTCLLLEACQPPVDTRSRGQAHISCSFQPCQESTVLDILHSFLARSISRMIESNAASTCQPGESWGLPSPLASQEGRSAQTTSQGW